jgi:hypothetical protein
MTTDCSNTALVGQAALALLKDWADRAKVKPATKEAWRSGKVWLFECFAADQVLQRITASVAYRDDGLRPEKPQGCRRPAHDSRSLSPCLATEAHAAEYPKRTLYQPALLPRNTPDLMLPVLKQLMQTLDDGGVLAGNVLTLADIPG